MRRLATPDKSKPYSRATLKQNLWVIPGGKITVGKVRDAKTLTETKELVSPNDPEVIFTIKKATNREDVERSNMFARVEYVQSADDGELITRREFPMGDLQVQTIKLCLVKWNLEDSKGQIIPVSENAILDCITPDERVFLYEQILDLNPIWTNRAEAKS